MPDDNVFDRYLIESKIFTGNRHIMRPSYVPENLPHRTEQIDQLAGIMSTALKGERPSNILIFGKTGTGKTAVAMYLGKELKGASSTANVGLDYIYLNCQVVDTPYGILQNVANRFIEDSNEHVPFTGLSLERVYSVLVEKIDTQKRVIFLVLDEIDHLCRKNGDDVLYHLTKINDDLKNVKICLVGISNDLRFTEGMDPRVKSRLGEEKVVFPPYNAEQLSDILAQRAKSAFIDGTLDTNVIQLCSALAAKEHGDARRALDLLRVAGELAERKEESKVTESHVNLAKNKIELDCINETIRTLPTHSKILLFSLVLGEESNTEKVTTGDLYQTYKNLSKKLHMTELTQRRITDFLSELDMLGIIEAKVKSYGRGGRTKEVRLCVATSDVRRILEEDELISSLKGSKVKKQTRLM